MVTLPNMHIGLAFLWDLWLGFLHGTLGVGVSLPKGGQCRQQAAWVRTGYALFVGAKSKAWGRGGTRLG